MCVTQLIWSVSSLPLLDHRFSVLVCLALPRAELVLLRLALRPCGRTPTGAVGRGRSRAAPPPGSRGPASPASLPPLAPLAPAKGLAGYGRAVAAYGGLFLRLPPTFHNVGSRYCSESAAPALRGLRSGALNPAVPCFLRGAQQVGRSASTPPAMQRPKRREGFGWAHPSPLFPLPLRGCLASSVYSALAVLTVCSCTCVRPSPRFPIPRWGCLASSASCALVVAVRCRHFGSLATALLVISVLGSPMEMGLVAPDHRTTPFSLNPPDGH